MEICDEAGVGGYDNRIQSEKHLGCRIRENREFQKRGMVTTTWNYFSGGRLIADWSI